MHVAPGGLCTAKVAASTKQTVQSTAEAHSCTHTQHESQGKEQQVAAKGLADEMPPHRSAVSRRLVCSQGKRSKRNTETAVMNVQSAPGGLCTAKVAASTKQPVQSTAEAHSSTHAARQPKVPIRATVPLSNEESAQRGRTRVERGA